MKVFITISFIACSLLASAQHPVDVLNTYFQDSGYVSTKKWSRSFNEDTSALMLRVLESTASKYYDDAVSYRINIDMLNDNSRWIQQQVSFLQKNNKFTYALTISKAERFNIKAYQANIDMYWVVSKDFYANVDFALGDKSLYPIHRSTVKLYYTGVKKLELAGGYSYIQFLNNPVRMYRASLGYYIASFYMHAEYLNINTNNENSHAIVAMLRNYLLNGKGYFSLNASAGMQANKYNIAGGFVNSSRVSGGFNYRVMPRLSFDVSLATERQKLREDFTREIISINTSVSYHFQINKKK